MTVTAEPGRELVTSTPGPGSGPPSNELRRSSVAPPVLPGEAVSIAGRAYVMEHSPYRGPTYWVHWRLGDLANEMNDYEIYETPENLAQQCRVSVRSVGRALTQLTADGYLLAVVGAAPGRRARVRFVFKGIDGPVGNLGKALVKPGGDPGDGHNVVSLSGRRRTGNVGQPVRDVGPSGRRSARGLLPTSTERQQKELPLEGRELSPSPSSPPPAAPDPWDRFWTAYPRHEKKVDARRAWDKAIKVADPEVIIAGAVRYRDDPNRDAGFTAHPSTWLNGGRWADDPMPRRRNGADRASSRTTAGEGLSLTSLARAGRRPQPERQKP